MNFPRDSDWLQTRIAERVTAHDAATPSWFTFRDMHPCSVCWQSAAHVAWHEALGLDTCAEYELGVPDSRWT